MPNAAPIIANILTNLQTDLINSMQSNGRYATGETIAALEIVVNDTNGQLLAPAYIDALEYGRGPTSQGAIAGDPTVFEQIEKWIDAKGLDLNPYAVTKQIHKQGYPGKSGVLTEPLSDDNVNMRTNEAMEVLANQKGQEIADMFNVFDNI